MSIGKESQLVDTLKHLIALDFDALSAYQAAIDRLKNVSHQRALQEFLTDHWRHIQELSPIVVDLGGTPPTHADARLLLTKGKVLIGQISGDNGILSAMLSNEDDTNSAYENACARTDAPPQVHEVLQRALVDERRHKTWIDRALRQRQQVERTSASSYRSI